MTWCWNYHIISRVKMYTNRLTFSVIRTAYHFITPWTSGNLTILNCVLLKTYHKYYFDKTSIEIFHSLSLALKNSIRSQYLQTCLTIKITLRMSSSQIKYWFVNLIISKLRELNDHYSSGQNVIINQGNLYLYWFFRWVLSTIE